ncbi:hypothetical protein GCM10010399_64000 [Dactylosporangium fulvum]|uniref:Uncharacterized protein n=1 Tax=Dactylosporangium fulvum TaxID=53359 RepID=A0ABY5W6R5_9ACTN|nr:hypothetical protein [Dactylosporangium fulvum]UWP85777.1 hypothetical protein Dfulv_16655 [Dactylosporangium fulvum]
MNESPGQTEIAYLVSGARLDDESVGPLFASCAEAHVIARTAIAGVGGTVRILRDSDRGWVEVARYTDTGRYPAPDRFGFGHFFDSDPATAPTGRRGSPRVRAAVRRVWLRVRPRARRRAVQTGPPAQKAQTASRRPRS